VSVDLPKAVIMPNFPSVDSQMPPSSNWANYMRMLDREPLRSETFYSLNLAGLEAVATSHRGSNCRVNKSCYAYGGDNIILEIVFADSSVWIARLRLHEPKFLQPRGEVDKIFLTEVATLRFLKRHTKIPVPTVFAYDARFQNEVGQPFMLMEGMPGKRLWGGMQTDYIPDEFKGNVFGQIADIMLELRSHPFQEIGMLYCEETEGMEASVRIGEIVDQHARLPEFGPFSNAADFYSGLSEIDDFPTKLSGLE
jgi:Phosphotransferase enzyme family